MQAIRELTDTPNVQRGVSYRVELPPLRTMQVTTFKERLKSRRSESGMSQREIAKEIGIDQSQYSRYEKGIMPNQDIIVSLAKALHCTSDYLLGLTDDPGANREFESLPEDEHNLVLVYREYKKGKHIPRIAVKMLRDLNVVEDTERPSIEGPKQSDTSGEEEAPNGKVV